MHFTAAGHLPGGTGRIREVPYQVSEFAAIPTSPWRTGQI